MIGIGANVHRLAALPLRVEAICGNVAVGCELRHASPPQAGRDVVFQKNHIRKTGRGRNMGTYITGELADFPVRALT